MNAEIMKWAKEQEKRFREADLKIYLYDRTDYQDLEENQIEVNSTRRVEDADEDIRDSIFCALPPGWIWKIVSETDRIDVNGEPPEWSFTVRICKD